MPRGECRSDRFPGLFTDWGENGRKQREARYLDGKLEGALTEWNENGGKRHGIFVYYDEDGSEMDRRTYKLGIEVDD